MLCFVMSFLIKMLTVTIIVIRRKPGFTGPEARVAGWRIIQAMIFFKIEAKLFHAFFFFEEKLSFFTKQTVPSTTYLG